jgi:hypothetical protein
LCGCDLAGVRLQRLAAAGVLGQVRVLDLSGNRLTDADGPALIAAVAAGPLRKFVFTGNDLSASALAGLCRTRFGTSICQVPRCRLCWRLPPGAGGSWRHWW